MSEFDYDLYVIGAGSGGVRASRIAAGHGARVAICEDSRVGGTCVIRGCVPKKLMSYAAHFAEDIEDAAGFGWQIGETRFDWPRFLQRKNAEIDRLNQIYLKLLANSGVTLHEGQGRLLNAHTVEVAGRQYTAEKILIAVGGRPVKPEFPGHELSLTSDDIFYIETLPRRMVIIGGGYIAVEFAGIFNALGSEVHLLYRGEQILRGFDADVRRTLAREMAAKGVHIHLHAEVQAVEKKGEERVVHLNTGETLSVDTVLCATGRVPRTEGLGLDKAGVYVNEKGEIPVDHDSKTNVANIFAVGDVTGRIALTPVAIQEGHAFADTQFGNKPWCPSHENVPSAVFSQPPVASVGLTEGEAHTLHESLDIYLSEFRPLKHTLSGREEKTLMKLVVCRETDRVLGCHMVGPDAPEIMQGVAIAIQCGATKAQFDATVGIHPTAAEELVTMRTPARSGH